MGKNQKQLLHGRIVCENGQKKKPPSHGRFLCAIQATLLLIISLYLYPRIASPSYFLLFSLRRHLIELVEAGQTDHNIHELNQCRARAEYGSHQVKLKCADKSPVECADGH